MGKGRKKTAAKEHAEGVARARELLERSKAEYLVPITPESLKATEGKDMTAQWNRMMAAYGELVREHGPKTLTAPGLKTKKRFASSGLDGLLIYGESTEFYELALIGLMKFGRRTEVSEAELALAIGCIVLADIAEVGENLEDE